MKLIDANRKDTYITFNNQKVYTIINYRRKRSINCRLAYGIFIINLNKSTRLSELDNLLTKFHEPVVRGEKLFTEDHCYILGKKICFQDIVLQKNKLTFNRCRNYFVKEAYNYFLLRIEYYKELFGIKDNITLKIKDFSSRYGTFSKTKLELCLSPMLFCFKTEISDLVVIHELAHYFYQDHQKKFKIFLKNNCPNYKIYARMLRIGALNGEIYDK